MSQAARPERNPAGYGNLADTVRGILGHSVAMVQARLSLARLESKDAITHLLWLLVFVAVALLALLLAYILGVVGLAFLLQRFAGWEWWAVTLVFAVMHLVVAGVLAFLAKRRLSKPFFQATITEFKKDREWLKPNISPSIPPKPPLE